MTDKTGGPAFPDPSRAVGSAPMGMTLRDYFAGQALAAMGGAICADADSLEELNARKLRLANWAYGYADAMLKARDVSDA